MKQIAVCDDEQHVLSEMRGYVNEYSVENQIPVNIITYTSAEQLLCSGLAFDLVILDIHMHGMNGMDAARRLREISPACPIIFLTALKDYVFDAFEVDAVNYLIKPVDKRKLFASIHKALKEDAGGLLVKQGYDYRKIRFADILYIEAMGRKVSIRLAGETIDYYQKFKELPGQLGEGFVLPHRSFLINLDHVKAVEGNDVVMDNGDLIPIARGKKEELAQSLLKHFGKDAP